MRVGKAYKCSQMSTVKVLVHELLNWMEFALGQVSRCTAAQLDRLVGSFVKK